MGTTEQETAKVVIGLISDGEVDGAIEQVFDAIRNRRRYLSDVRAAQNQVEIQPGANVRIIGGIKPKYLSGCTGTVSDETPRRPKDVMVELGWDAGRYRNSVVGIPANCLELISGEEA